jgi:hypothetical protein
MTNSRLKASEVPGVRAKILEQQSGVCVLCNRPPEVPVLDHNHSDGYVRGVLCRGCNSLLGVIENNRARYGLKNITAFALFLSRVFAYLRDARYPFDYPTHRTTDEKRIARNTKARKQRAESKGSV